MQFTYSLALLLGMLICAPYFIVRGLRYKKYFSDFGQRFGRLGRLRRPAGALTIWVHSVSVGETLSAGPLIDLLAREYPQAVFALSTTTETGQSVVRGRNGERAFCFYFPFDFAFCVRRALDVVRPSLVVIVETEIWPNFLHECNRREIPVALVNARLSDRSYAGYRMIRPFMRRTLEGFAVIAVQSERDRDRFLALGVPEDRILASGNLKYDLPADEHDGSEAPQGYLPQDGVPLIVAGSTAEGEEEIVLQAFRRAKAATGRKLRLLIAPRRPERFDEVERMVKRQGVSFTRRSGTDRVPNSSEVILLDTIGELAGVYSQATVVFVGGSLIKRGGHNIIEPARFGKPIVVGPHTENFRQVVDDFLAARSVIQLSPAEPERLAQALGATFATLLNSPAEREALGRQARLILQSHQGAASRIGDQISRFIREQPQRHPAPISRTD